MVSLFLQMARISAGDTENLSLEEIHCPFSNQDISEEVGVVRRTSKSTKVGGFKRTSNYARGWRNEKFR